MFGDDLYFGSPIVGTIIKVRVLVVDDDSTCLAFTAGLLKLFNYQVGTARSAVEALANLRANVGLFDIVISEVHMPGMTGVELQKIVEVDFNIPVLLTSSDPKERLVTEVGLNRDACVIMKPPSMMEIRNIWQYVIACRKNKNNPRKQGSVKSECSQKRKSSDDDDDVDENNTAEEDDASTKPNKKQKMIWTTPLHNKFLEAIRAIGYNRAVPKKILEFMNVPGLTRENIASHLQKYRIYLRRICEAGAAAGNGMPENWNQRPFRSSFTWSQFPLLANNSFLLNYANAFNLSIIEQEELRKKYASKSIATLESAESDIVRPWAKCFGSSNKGFKSLINDTTFTVIAPEYLTCNDLSTIPLNILESSLVGAPKTNNSATPGNPNGALTSAPTPSNESNVITTSSMVLTSNSAQKVQVSAHEQQLDVAQVEEGFGENLVDEIDAENHVVQYRQPPIADTSEFSEHPNGVDDMPTNFVEQPHYVVTVPQANHLTNFMNKHSTNVANMSNDALQSPGGVGNYGVSQHEPKSTFPMPKMQNFVQKHQQQSANVVNMPSYILQQPQQESTNVVNMSPMASKFMLQQSQQQSATVVNMTPMASNYMLQQPQSLSTDVVNMIHDFEEPQPQFGTIERMKNIFITPQQLVMPNNVNNPSSQSMIADNQLNTLFATTNGLQKQGVQGFDFKSETIEQLHDWAMSTTYEDFSMEHLEKFADGLLSNIEPHIGDNNDEMP